MAQCMNREPHEPHMMWDDYGDNGSELCDGVMAPSNVVKLPVTSEMDPRLRHPSYIPPTPRLKPVEPPRRLDLFYCGLDVDELTVRLDKYLSMKHTNTWPPEQFSVSDDERREEAIDWFVDMCIKLGIVDVTVDDPRRVIP